MKNTAILLVLFVLFTFNAFSQGINIFDIDTNNYPIIKAKFYAYDKDGKIQRPTKDQLKIIENGIERKIIDVSCPIKEPIAISSVLTFDVSGSMSSGPNGVANLDLAKTAAKSWIAALPTKESQAAITSFDDQNYIIQDFTRDNNKLLAAIEKLKPQGGTDYNKGFIEPMGGGILMAKTGKYKRVLIFLTDGQPNFEPDVQKIINEAKINNITIFAVTLGMYCPQNLKDISTQTNGYWYENVTTLQEAKNVYLNIMNRIQDDPCDISWESGVGCSNGNVTLELKYSQLSEYFNYRSPQNGIFVLEFNPKLILVFKNKEVGKSYDTTITIKAINSDVEIYNITSSNPQFDINPKSFNLTKNQSKNLTISYSPIDVKYNYTKFEFINNICVQNFNSSAYTYKIKNNSLKLTHPNGNELFLAGSDTVITWEGIAEKDEVTLLYSNDSGQKWNVLDTNVLGLKYNWKNIPLPSSNQCLVKINQLVSKESNSSNDSVVTLSGHTNQVHGVAFSTDGNRIVTGSYDSTAKMWEVNTGVLIRTFSGHTNQVHGVAFSPDGNRIATASRDYMARIWDANSGTLILTLKGHVGPVRGVVFSPDGNRIATVSSDYMARIWDSNTGAQIHYFSHNRGIHGVAYSPDGSTVATASEDKTARIWNANTGTLIRTISGHTDEVIGVAYSPDGVRIATISDDRTAKIWDANTGTLILNIPIKIGLVHGVVFSPDGNNIVLTNSDYTAKILDANTGELIRTLSGHKQSVYGVAYSLDGSKIATTGGYDRTAKIWNVDPAPIQSDQSDAVFSIVSPEVKARDIDMKKLLVGTVKDSVVVGFIENIGSYKCRIDSIYFEGEQFDEFQVVSGIPVFTVDVSKDYSVEFRFKPKAVGIRKSTIVIITQADTLRYKITGEGIQPMVQVLNNFIDFGKVNVKENKDSLQAKTIKNVGSADLKITKIYQYGPNLTDFTEITPLKDVILKPNEELKMDLRFNPKFQGRTSGTLMFEYEGIGSPAVVQLFGEGISNNPNCDGRGFVFENFNTTSKIKLVGSAELTQDSTVRLTDTKSNQVGGVTYGERLALRSSFEMYFSFRMSNGNNNQFIDGSLPGADGFAVLFQNGKNFRTTANGGSLGFNGIENCVALEIDMYKNDNEFFDPNGNHVALQVPKDNIITAEHSAARTVAMNDQIFELRPDSTVYYGKLVYDADKKQIQFFLDSTNKYNNLVLTADNFDFSQYLQLELGDFAHIGITSTTGAATQIHELLSWEFCSERDEFLSVEDRYYESDEVKQIDNILKLETGNIKEIEVMDITGKVLINKDINNNEINLNELGISTGIYFIILKDDQNRSHFRKVNLVR